jgi:hypothetical protein
MQSPGDYLSAWGVPRFNDNRSHFQNGSERPGEPRVATPGRPKAACTVPAAPRPHFERRDRARLNGRVPQAPGPLAWCWRRSASRVANASGEEFLSVGRLLPVCQFLHLSI